jgi:hypothetical protein
VFGKAWLLCFGDSLTYGTGSSKGMDYPAQLSRMIGLPVMNTNVFDGILGIRSLMSDPSTPTARGTPSWRNIFTGPFSRICSPY